MSDAEHEEAMDALLEKLGQDDLTKLLHDRARKRLHAREKLRQPECPLGVAEDHWRRMAADFMRPLVEDEIKAQNVVYLCHTVVEMVQQGYPEDAFFAALRVVRWVSAYQPGLAPLFQSNEKGVK